MLALGALFLGRLAFGLTSEFWSEDETQIYLLGLRYYATGHWPYFGADVVWTMSQIAGALQPLLVGVPLRIAPVPEAPFILLNLLSFAALCGLAAYITRREPTLPRWLVWGWLLTVPWTLQFSTHVNNPSYVLPAAIVFFIGFFEAVPALSLGVAAPRLAFFGMGAAIAWIMQIHLSWPLLLPFAAIALLMRGPINAEPAALAASSTRTFASDLSESATATPMTAAAVRAVPGRQTGSTSQRSTSALMKRSTCSRAASSGSCRGGCFMTYDEMLSSGPAMPRSSATWQQRIASITQPAELGLSCTERRISSSTGALPKPRPSMRRKQSLLSRWNGT